MSNFNELMMGMTIERGEDRERAIKMNEAGFGPTSVNPPRSIMQAISMEFERAYSRNPECTTIPAVYRRLMDLHRNSFCPDTVIVAEALKFFMNGFADHQKQLTECLMKNPNPYTVAP